MKPIYITSAYRTAIGSFLGTLSSIPAHELGAIVVKACMAESKITGDHVDEVIMGQVLTAGVGQNPARQTAMLSDIPQEKTAITINQVCGSGLRAVAMGFQSIACEDANVVIAGGQENMSLSPHVISMRNGQKMGNANLKDSMISDGLWDCFNDYHMGQTAENIAEKWQFSREDQDAFAAHSQSKAEKAISAGRFKDEIVPVEVKMRKEIISFATDEYARAGTTKESLAKLRPAFVRDGTVTAGNASGINDGAAAVTMMSEEMVKNKNIHPLAKMVSWATAGVDPSIMGTGPIPATQKALEKAGWSIDDLDLVEANEAFAAQSLSVVKELGLNPDIVNVNGGAIALGHPIGASGARVLVTLIHEMKKRNLKKGLATLCIGGGMGIAVCIEMC